MTIRWLDEPELTERRGESYERLGYTLAGGIPNYARDHRRKLSANAIFYRRR